MNDLLEELEKEAEWHKEQQQNFVYSEHMFKLLQVTIERINELEKNLKEREKNIAELKAKLCTCHNEIKS